MHVPGHLSCFKIFEAELDVVHADTVPVGLPARVRLRLMFTTRREQLLVEGLRRLNRGASLIANSLLHIKAQMCR